MSLTKNSYSMIQGAPVNVLDYGADPTGTNDSTSAIQSAMNFAASLNGSTLYFPNGTYNCSGQLTLSSVAIGINFVGVGIDNTSLGGSKIVYTGTATTFINISATNTRFIGFEKLDISSNNSSFTGTLINISVFNLTISDCHFSANSNATAVLNLNNSINSLISRLYIRGGINNVVGSGNNGTVFQQCDFGAQSGYAVSLTSSEALNFVGCVFEPDVTNVKASGLNIVTSYGVNIQGCWFGDVVTVSTSPTSNWINFSGNGLNVIGNYFNGDGYHLITPVFISASSVGVTIIGNLFSAFPSVINVGAGLLKELTILSNSLNSNVDSIVVGTISSGGSMFSQGYLFGLPDGSIHTNHFVTIPTTVANLPAASTNIIGARSFVTDSNALTFNSVVAGGGTYPVPVYCNGSVWLIG